jgi:hypothetical protein
MHSAFLNFTNNYSVLNILRPPVIRQQPYKLYIHLEGIFNVKVEDIQPYGT